MSQNLIPVRLISGEWISRMDERSTEAAVVVVVVVLVFWSTSSIALEGMESGAGVSECVIP